MSVDLMRLVWERDMSAADKAVLLKLADHANDEGDSVYPRRRRVAAYTGLSESAVARVLRKYIERGLLAVVERGGGRGNPTRYCINVEVLRAMPKVDFENYKPCQGDTVSEPDKQVGEGLFDPLNHVTVTPFSDGNRVTGTDKPCHPDMVSEPTLYRESLTIIEPSSSEEEVKEVLINRSGDDKKPCHPDTVSKVFAILNELPACRNASGAKPAHCAELMAEHEDLNEADWIDFARWCRDKLGALPRYGGANTTWAETPSKIMREQIRRWKGKHRPAPVAEREESPFLVVVEDDARARIFVGAAEADCLALMKSTGKWLPADRTAAQAKGLEVCDITDADREAFASDRRANDLTGRDHGDVRHGMRKVGE